MEKNKHEYTRRKHAFIPIGLFHERVEDEIADQHTERESESRSIERSLGFVRADGGAPNLDGRSYGDQDQGNHDKPAARRLHGADRCVAASA